MRTIATLTLLLLTLLWTPHAALGRNAPPDMVGTWAGHWTETGWRGWARVSISSSGSCSGSIVRFTDGEVGTIGGSVDRDGNGSITVQYGDFEVVTTAVALKPAPRSLIARYTYANGFGRAVRGSFAGKPWPGSWPDVSRYAGVWTGDWSGQGQRGSVRLEVAPNGQIAATAVNLTLGFTSTLRGTLDPSGVFWAEVRAPGQPQSTLAGQLTHHGPSVSGTFTQNLGGWPFKGKFRLARIDPAQFEGSWSGTWKAHRLKGTIAIVIDIQGAVTGTVADATTGQSGVLQGQIGESGVFTGVIRYPNSAPIPTEGLARWVGRNIQLVYNQVIAGVPVRTSATLRRAP